MERNVSMPVLYCNKIEDVSIMVELTYRTLATKVKISTERETLKKVIPKTTITWSNFFANI